MEDALLDSSEGTPAAAATPRKLGNLARSTADLPSSVEDALLDSGERKEQTPAAGATPHSLGKLVGNLEISLLVTWPAAEKEQTPAAAATPRKLLLVMAAVLAIAYAAFVIYVSATYPHSWIEKLQMLPLCIVAITAPMLCTIM